MRLIFINVDMIFYSIAVGRHGRAGGGGHAGLPHVRAVRALQRDHGRQAVRPAARDGC